MLKRSAPPRAPRANAVVARASRLAPGLALVLRVALVLGCVLGCVASCSKCGGATTGSDPAQTTTPLEPPLPAPDDLLAELTMGSPNASWAKLQRGIGGPAGILPASAGGIVCAAAGLDPSIASEVDGVAPAYGALAGDPANASFVLALKLVDLRKARGALVDGDTARYTGREAGEVTELLARGQDRLPVIVGISRDGYLLLARRTEDLKRLAPYVTRTLPRRPLPAEGAIVVDVPRVALGSVVKPKLDELWSTAKAFLLAADERSRRDHGGRAPDFADPRALVGAADGWVTRHLAVAGDLEKMRVALDVSDDSLSVVTTLTPLAGTGAASTWIQAMTLGDTASFAALPATSAVALMMRDGEAARADQGAALDKALASALGPRLAEADAKKLHDVLDDASKARGDLVVSAIAWDEPQGVSLRGSVRDAEAATRALRGAVELARVAPFKDIFRVRSVTTTSEELARVGKASMVMLVREPPRTGLVAPMPSPRGGDAGAPDARAPLAVRHASRSDLGMAWVIESGTLSLAASDAPLATLAASVHPDRRLGDEPAVARALAALGSSSSAVLVVQPLRFDPMRANLPAAPLVVALGRKDRDATLRVDVGNGLLRELARRQLGL